MKKQETQRVTLNLSKRNVQWIDSNCNNRSAFVDEFLDKAREGGGMDVDSVIKRHELARLKNKREEMKNSVENLNDQIDRYESELKQQSAMREEVLTEARDMFEGMDVAVDNPAVKRMAEKAEMTPAELLEEIK